MSMSQMIDTAVRALAALSVLSTMAVAVRPNAVLRAVATTALALGALGLAASLALPALLPPDSMVLRADGSTADPRVLTALLVGLAALVLLLPLARAIGVPALRPLAAWVTGALVAGLTGAVGFMAGLKNSSAIAGLAIGGFVAGAALAFAVRTRRSRVDVAMAGLAFGISLLVVGAMTSLHGARASQLQVAEGGHADALALRVGLVATEAPNDSLRRLRFVVAAPGRNDTLWTELRGRAGAEGISVAGARALGGPVLVPLALRERNASPHQVTWFKKGETVQSGEAKVTFEKFRFVMGEPIRLYADLEVASGGRTVKVSPGATADSSGMAPFAVTAEGYGPITIAGVDADNGRVGLMLPTANKAHLARTALLEVRRRPGLELAWAGLALALVAFLLGFGAAGTRSAPRAERTA